MRTSNGPVPDISYAVAAELAAAADLDAASAVITRRFRHLLSHGSPASGAAEAAPSRVEAIGPWRRREDGGIVRYVKDPDAPWGWAEASHISARKTARRVVFIGESVARGFLLDPLFTCAGALQAICDGAAGDGAIEIVDLAKNGMPPAQAIALMEASAALEPDLYVVFAGNNLLCVNDVYDFRDAAAALGRGGSWRDAAAYAHSATARQAARFVARLAATARAQGVPLAYVVPPYNQRDWHPYEWWTNPLLTAHEQRARRRGLERAERLLGAGRVAEAEETAREIETLEEDASPCALRLLARAAIATHELDRARTLYDAAADALITLPAPALLLTAPRIAEALRAGCAAEHAVTIDLPHVFASAQDGMPSGRELFIDHIHLSDAGIRLAMAAIAERVLPLLGFPARTFSELHRAAPEASADAIAQGHFLAAQFNAYYGQPLDVIRYHTERAAHASPDILTAMAVHVRRSVPRFPDLVCPGHDQVRALNARFTGIVWSLARPNWHWKRLHLGLVRMWTDLLRDRGVPDIPPFDAELAARRGVGASPLHLLDAQQPDGQPIGLPYRRTSTVIAREPESAFWFSWDRPGESLHLRIVSRVPSAAAGGTVTLRVNGEPVREWFGKTTWSSVDCLLPGDMLTRGVNIVRVDWPDRLETRADRVRQLTSFLTAHAPLSSVVIADRQLYATYGEICLLSATATTAAATAIEPAGAVSAIASGGPAQRIASMR